MTVVILTSGTSWSRPIDCPNILDSVECWGAGGAGRHTSQGEGGGGGAYSRKNNYNIGLRSVFSIQIPGNTPYESIAVDTWFDNSTTGVLAESGNTAEWENPGRGGRASNCIGDVSFDGGNGSQSGILYFLTCGAGGGAASNQSQGVNATNATIYSHGSGGDAGTGGGIGGGPNNNGTSSVNGGGGGGGNCGNGGYPGGGGGGGNSKDTGNIGGRGQITITYTPLTNMVLSIISSRCQL